MNDNVGHMIIWVYGYMGIWLYGHMGIWLCGYMGIWVFHPLRSYEFAKSILLIESLTCVGVDLE